MYINVGKKLAAINDSSVIINIIIFGHRLQNCV